MYVTSATLHKIAQREGVTLAAFLTISAPPPRMWRMEEDANPIRKADLEPSEVMEPAGPATKPWARVRS